MKKGSNLHFKSSFMALFCLFLLSCSQQEQSKPIPAQEVNVVQVEQREITNYVEYVGQVLGYIDIQIRARVDGFLDGIHFEEGAPVKKGQLLYTIDSQPFRAEVSAYKSKLAEAQTALAKAESDLNRYKPLAATNAVSKADLDAAQAQYDAALASVHAAEANLEMAKIKLSYTQIKSPINGIIGKTQAKIGEYVGSSMNTIVLNTVSQIDEIMVEFFLPENQYLMLVRSLRDANDIFMERPNTEGKLELVLADGTMHNYKGWVNFIDRGIDPNTGTILIQTTFKNPQRIIRPGQYTKVRIPIPVNNAIIVPQRCVVELQGQYSVMVVKDDNTVESRPIEPGMKKGDLWIINEGLKAGEKIIIDGLQKVRNGSAVEASLIEFNSQTESN